MDELFTPVSTTYRKGGSGDGPQLKEVKTASTEPRQRSSYHSISNIDEALEALKGQPDYELLVLTLKFLQDTRATADPSPKSAALIQSLVSDIVPNYWTVLYTESENEEAPDHNDLDILISCLSNVTSLNSILAHIKSLLRQASLQNHQGQAADTALHIGIFLHLLSTVLKGNHSVELVRENSLSRIRDAALKKLQAQTLISITAGGKILSLASEAIGFIGVDKTPKQCLWLGNGEDYTRWIGGNVCSLAQSNVDSSPVCFDLVQRTMSLGYSDTLLRMLIDRLLLTKDAQPSQFVTCCFLQPQRMKRTMDFLINYLAQKFLNLSNSENTSVIAAVASIIESVVSDDADRRQHLVGWCTSSSGAGLGDAIGIRRAILAVLAEDKDIVVTVLEKCLSQFGDELYIRHAAILQQEVHAQLLLLSAGYVNRLSPLKFKMVMRSGTYLTAISNRIASTQPRTRMLGMVVGETLSALIDGSEGKLDFKMEDTEAEEAAWLKSLVHIQDSVGSAASIRSLPEEMKPVLVSKQIQQTTLKKPRSKPVASAAQHSLPKAIIEEIDSSDSDDDDLVPYAKGSDPEDSDDDATLVQRNKVKAPVYVRDLITYLRDVESYDKQKLALKTAPTLIRRKANYGTEVSSHAEELASLLVGLQDKFELDDFEEMKRQGIMALIVAQPKLMAPWFARSFFEGDYSLSQRTAVLVSIGLSARELAGYDVSAHQTAASFASKQLPAKIEALYLQDTSTSCPGQSQLKALPNNAIESIAKDLVSDFLAPVAADAADAQTGPDVLKLETYKARYKNSSLTRPRVRAIPNTTASVLASYFFSPLTAHFQVALRSPRSVTLNPALLAIYLQTLGVIIHAAGPSTLALPQLTSELWNLLLGVRVHAAEDLGALRGWLVAMATLLEVNGGDMRRLCETQGREIVETREWVSRVFERIRGGDGGDENDVKMLSAGVLIKLGEAIEKYQALLMGDMIGYT